MLTDEQIDAVTDAEWGFQAVGVMYEAYRAYARAIEAEVRKEIEAAVLAELEACAQLCDEREDYLGEHAKAIRARTPPMRIDDAHKE